MIKLIPYISFLSANYVLQFFQDVPDYILATERSWFMLVGMIFANFYMTWLWKKYPNG